MSGGGLPASLGAAPAGAHNSPVEWEETMGKMDGGCTCGNLRYTATGEPDLVAICNCTDCQRQSGSRWPASAECRNSRQAGAGASSLRTETFSGSSLQDVMAGSDRCPLRTGWRDRPVSSSMGAQAGTAQDWVDAGQGGGHPEPW